MLFVLFFARSGFLRELRVQKCFAPSRSSQSSGSSQQGTAKNLAHRYHENAGGAFLRARPL